MSEDDLETVPDELTYSDWVTAIRDGTVLGQHCGDCGHATAAPKAACARCGNRDIETVELPTTGTVYTETRLEVVPEGFDGPYHIVLVDLDDARVMAHVPEPVEIGQTVELAGTIENEGVAPVFEPN
ncbi:hypothetical protein SAMN04487967_3610 [Natronorubrum sediminis]|uniref:DUF35 domain-containing protein n=1 Tax=Natronorubrum sediminis TaxID=640943 RepID=A0A1H6G7X7_9EURY|nr:OB-fold domain-containing protein [Natronorubrum sediminis]SEH18084.1 hypothetical protein SAMN04487967_3610 [Natronorubrum sediminis]